MPRVLRSHPHGWLDVDTCRVHATTPERLAMCDSCRESDPDVVAAAMAPFANALRDRQQAIAALRQARDEAAAGLPDLTAAME